MNWTLFLTILFLSPVYALDDKNLNNKIDSLNDIGKVKESIILLEKITSSNNTDQLKKSYAYILKAITYKRFYNYPEALNNLNLALKSSKGSVHYLEVESRVKLEKLFIYFDTKQKHKFEALLKDINSDNLKFVKSETRVFYESILGHIELEKGNLEKAEKYFDYCIILLEKENPRHLPTIYKVKVNLYNKMNKKDLALGAFEKGMYYANKYNVDLYKIVMLETLLYYYIDNNDYKNAYFTQLKVSKERLKYNDREVSGNLIQLEKKILDERITQERLENKALKYIMISIIILLLLLLFFLSKKLILINKKHKIITYENEELLIKLNEINYIKEKKANDYKDAIDLNPYNLSYRQIEIVKLIRQDKSNKEISSILFISENTVKYHLKKIFEILNISSRSDLKSKNII
ncbi:helix-turn-helix domain-containing protein [Faecalibacter macacae]|nr:helix-turn-helix transcriptional regulator [Faecalibacter macacae]